MRARATSTMIIMGKEDFDDATDGALIVELGVGDGVGAPGTRESGVPEKLVDGTESGITLFSTN